MQCQERWLVVFHFAGIIRSAGEGGGLIDSGRVPETD